MSEQTPIQQPQPVEFQIDDESTVRGLLWPGETLPVLFIHDLGDSDDLDTWGSLPETVNRAGHTVLAIDLPGHGLSDGEPTLANAERAIQQSFMFLSSRFGPSIAVVASGAASGLVPHAPIAAAVLFSPNDEVGAAEFHPKLIFVGAVDATARAAADRYLRASRGWTLVSSFATTVQGAGMLQTDHGPKIASQVLSFLRDYGPPTRRT